MTQPPTRDLAWRRLVMLVMLTRPKVALKPTRTYQVLPTVRAAIRILLLLHGRYSR